MLRLDDSGWNRVTTRPLAAAILAGVLALASAAASADASRRLQFNIAAQVLTTALVQFSDQAGLQFTAPGLSLSEVRSREVKGEYAADVALNLLLKDTGFTYRFVDEGTVAIQELGKERSAAAVLGGGIQLAQAASSPSQGEAAGKAGRADDKGVEPMLDGSESKQQVQEIVVTATRRSESLENVPMSIAAIGSEEISRRNLGSATDFLRTLAGVNQIEGGAGQNSVVIRGIAVNPTGEGYSSSLTTGTFFGEVPLSAGRVGQTDLRLIDIERVEVLRGPQGTQFGSGSIAGAVRYIPQSPKLSQLEGEIGIGYSRTAHEGGDNDNIEGIINIPVISDTLAIRASGYRHFNSGYVRNIAATDPLFAANAAVLGISDLLGSGRVGNTATTGGRVALLWSPTESLSLTLTYLEQRMHQNGLLRIQTDSSGTYYGALPGDLQARYLLTSTFGGQQGLADNSEISNGLLKYDAGWAEVISSTSYLSQVSRERTDAGVYFGSYYSGNPIAQGYEQDSRTLVEELRMTSKLDGPFNFIAGLYYEDVRRGRNASNRWSGTLESLGVFFPEAGSEREVGTYDSTTKQKQKAAYGELSYELPHGLTATVGGRHYRYDTDDVVALNGPMFGGPSGSGSSGSDTGNVYKANVSFKASAGLLLYATWSQGFRLGYTQAPLPSSCDDGSGFVEGYPGVPITGPLVKPDKLDNYELGAKLGLLDSRMTINAALFDIAWRGLPVAVYPPCQVTLILNAGNARSRGVELESKVALARGVTLTAGGSWTDAMLTNDAPGIGLNHDVLPGAPKYNLRIALDYSFNAFGYSAYVQSDVSRVGSFYGVVGEQGRRLGAYTEVGLRGGADVGAISIQVYANNLTNERGMLWTDPSTGATNILRPATIGIDLGYRF